jgi:nitroreductase
MSGERLRKVGLHAGLAGDKKPHVAEICRLVGAPQGHKLVSLIPIGYPAESPEKSKRPLSDVLHWEKY